MGEMGEMGEMVGMQGMVDGSRANPGTLRLRLVLPGPRGIWTVAACVFRIEAGTRLREEGAQRRAKKKVREGAGTRRLGASATARQGCR